MKKHDLIELEKRAIASIKSEITEFQSIADLCLANMNENSRAFNSFKKDAVNIFSRVSNQSAQDIERTSEINALFLSEDEAESARSEAQEIANQFRESALANLSLEDLADKQLAQSLKANIASMEEALEEYINPRLEQIFVHHNEIQRLEN